MPSATLSDRALISVSGPEALHFLQNIVTTDLDSLGEGVARPGALLSPQGKILFDFLVSRCDGSLVLECRKDIADDFLRRLMLYRLRAKVEIEQRDESLVTVFWDIDSGGPDSDSDSQSVRDLRFRSPVFRCYGAAQGASMDTGAYTALRIASGIAESGSDYALGDAFPHDVLLDQMNGVGFKKGCYVGQEVVSRMQHRGTARRRVLITKGEAPLPHSGTEITAAGRSLGTLGSISGANGLAVVRIDRVKDAMDEGTPLLAAGVEVHLAIPAFANFTFPGDVPVNGGA